MSRVFVFLIRLLFVWGVPLCAAIANGEGRQSYWKALKQTWKQWWED